MSRPIITFALVAYNQEAFIRDAMRGALAQTYSPLEIIVSDDCSTDGTFEIARQMVSAYRGPHMIRLNRNPHNFGLGRNVNRVMELCQGKLVVAAGGDDVSLPERCEILYDAWDKSGRRATSIFSSYHLTSKNGIRGPVGGRHKIEAHESCVRINGTLSGITVKRAPVVNGCTHAWSPALFDFFGPLQSDLEDFVLSFRTLAIGEMIYVDRPLVEYRRHGNNISFLGDGDDTRTVDERERRLRSLDEKSSRAFQNLIDDIKALYRAGRIGLTERDALIRDAQRAKDKYDLELSILDAGFIRRIQILTGALRRGASSTALRLAPRILPRQIYRNLYSVKLRLVTARRPPI